MGQIWAGGDSVHTFWPYHDYTRQALLKSKEIPWWNPHLFGGFPFFSNLQSAIFYWPRWLLLGLPAEMGIGASILLHGAWLGTGVSLYLRQRSCSLEAAAAGAWLVLAGGFFSTHLYAGHVNFIEAASWLPWLLLCWEFWVTSRKTSSLAGAAICLSTSFLAGHPQISLYLALVWGFFALVDLLTSRLWFRDWALALGVVLALFLMMGAFQLYPAQVIGEFSTRKAAGPDYAHGAALPLTALPGLVFPYGLGAEPFENHLLGGNSWELSCWLGICAWVVLVAGLFSKAQKSSWFWLWLFLGALALVLALGTITPVYPLALKIIPGLSMVRAPGRFVLVLLFALAIATALVLDKIPKEIHKTLFVLAGLAGLGGVLLLALSIHGSPASFIRDPLLQLAPKMGKGDKNTQTLLADAASLMTLNGLWAISLGAALASGGFVIYRGHSIARGLLLAVLLESALLILPFHNTAPAKQFAWSSPPDLEGRAVSLRDRPDMDDLLRLRIHALEGFDPVILESYRQTLNLFLKEEIPASTNGVDFEGWVDPLFDFLAVKWVLPEKTGWKENQGAFPMVWTKPSWPRRPLSPKTLVEALRPGPDSRASLNWKGHNAFSIYINCGPNPCVLMSSLPLAPGWSFRLEGKDIKPLALMGHFLALDLPPGKLRLEGSYTPPGLRILGPLALLGWVLGLWLLFGKVQFRRTQSPVKPKRK